MKDVCIYCGEELVFSEQTRSYCWMCREMTEEAYSDDVYYENR